MSTDPMRAAPPAQAPAFLTQAEAARRLGVSVSTLFRMRRDGQLRTVPLRGKPMIPAAEIERLAAQ